MSFKYKEVKRPNGTIIKAPYIPIVLKSDKESIDVVGLIDSGADISVIPKEMAEILGLRLEKEDESTGVGGKARTADSHVNIKIEKGHEKYEFRLPIKVLLQENSEIPVLLGRLAFFDNFNIIFEQSNQRVILKKITFSYNVK
ncbi:MAG: retropepsin-like aspartic protease [Nanoarchaeota archaeon]